MKKNILLMSAAVLTAAIGLSACAESTLPPGKYESNKTSVDSNGTKYQKKSSTTVTEDANGNRTVDMETENSKDPKGLFNKKTNTSKKVITTSPSDDN